jgi:hypothetical protein
MTLYSETEPRDYAAHAATAPKGVNYEQIVIWLLIALALAFWAPFVVMVDGAMLQAG